MPRCLDGFGIPGDTERAGCVARAAPSGTRVTLWSPAIQLLTYVTALHSRAETCSGWLAVQHSIYAYGMALEERLGGEADTPNLEGSGWYGPTQGSSTATLDPVATIPQKELRNNVGEVLRRAEAGEQMTITVAGRPVAELGPARSRRWVNTGDLRELWDLPADPKLKRDLQRFDARLRDPWTR